VARAIGPQPEYAQPLNQIGFGHASGKKPPNHAKISGIFVHSLLKNLQTTDEKSQMSSLQKIDDALRERIISSPEAILDDRELMRALIAANEKTMGGNIVDLRGIAMERLEARLDRLEDTHRSVIAAAYENLAGTNQIHRAILRMLDPLEFEPFLRDLGGEVAEILRVDVIKLVLESAGADTEPAVTRLGAVLKVAGAGFIEDYVSGGRNAPARPVVLRQLARGDEVLYGQSADFIRSEACLRLDFGLGRLPGMLVMGSEDPHQFTPQQGTDLLTFFGGVFERAMRRWLA
jgi:uncharacterized protein YigA (DUF484 family)